MTEVVIDTNVAVIANRQNPQVVETCVAAAIQFLTDVRANHVVLIDTGDEIRAEYAGALQMRRPYELGAQFLIHVLQQQFNPDHVRRVDLPKDDDGSFVDFPDAVELEGFDLSDRKFAALARKEGVPVTNAADSDWANDLDALNANGILVDFLCGADQATWFVEA